jgi:AcrR family transcriptional regulator
MLNAEVSDDVESRYFNLLFARAITGDPFSISVDEITSSVYLTQASFFRRYVDKEYFFRKALRIAIQIVLEKKAFDPTDALTCDEDKTNYSKKLYGPLAYVVRFVIERSYPDFVEATIFSPFASSIKREISKLAPNLDSKSIYDLSIFYLWNRLSLVYQKLHGLIPSKSWMNLLIHSFRKWQCEIFFEAETQGRKGVKKDAVTNKKKEPHTSLS